MRTVQDELRLSVRRSGLTQTGFAVAAGTSQPRLSTYLSGSVSPSAHFFLRAQQLGLSLAGLARLHLLSAPTLGLALRSALAKDEQDWAFRLLMQGRDHLRLALSRYRDLDAGWTGAPRSSGRSDWDTLTASVVAHEFHRAGMEAPRWTRREPLMEA